MAIANPTTVLSFTVNKIGKYALLQLDDVLVTNGAAGAGPPPNTGPLPPPPLNEDMTGTPPTANPPAGGRGRISLERFRVWLQSIADKLNADAPLGSELQPVPLDELTSALTLSGSTGALGQAASTPRAAWRGWFLALVQRVNQLSGSAGGGAVLVNFEAPSLDETDIDWYATTGPISGATDPVTFTVTVHGGKSRFGRTFAVGDYIEFVDPHLVGTTGQRAYEVMQLTIVNGAQWTAQRRPSGAPLGTSAFGTATASHDAGIKIYRLIDKQWNVTVPIGVPQVFAPVWANMDVAAVVGTPSGGNPVLVTLVGGTDAVPTPGFRTLSGPEYLMTMGGTLAAGQVADYRVRVDDWHSFRQLIGRLNGDASSGVNPTLIKLVYITPDSLQAATAADLVISGSPIAQRLTYAGDPTGTRFPFPVPNWPPHVMTAILDPFDANGKLKLPLMPAGYTITLSEDGYFDLMCMDASAGGSDFIMAVQT